MQTTTTGSPAQSLPPFDYPPALRPCYAIAQGTTADDLARRLSIRLGHLCCVVASADPEQEDVFEVCYDMARECRELFTQIQARRGQA
jgi:hypothetical protein